jgi:membrane protease YdiL (CAAX protease family)
MNFNLKDNRVFKTNAMFLGLLLLINVAGLNLPEWLPTEATQYVIILAPTLILAFILKLNFKERFKIKPIKLTTVIYCVILTAAMAPISILVSELTTYVFGVSEVGIVSFLERLGSNPIRVFFILAITPAICEEFIMRGLLIDLKSKVSIHHLAILNAVLFGLFHTGYDQVFYTMVIGLVIAYAVIITGSIIPGILIHFFNNSMSAFSLLTSDLSTVDYSRSPELSVILKYIPYSIIGAIIIFFVLKRLIKVYQYSDEARIPKEETEPFNLFFTYLPIIIVALVTYLLNYLILSGVLTT